jgi:hypothetical protein
MKDFIKKNVGKLFIIALASWAVGLGVEAFVGIWYKPQITSWVMIPLMIGVGVTFWNVLRNNPNLLKKK